MINFVQIHLNNVKNCLHYVLFKMFFLPIFLYFIIFLIFTYPLIFQFSSHLFTEGGDGYVYIWNIWWINEAVTQFHQVPWNTTYLFFPYDTSLLNHDYLLLFGFLGIFFLKFLTLSEYYNLLVIFSFVGSGFTLFLLANYFSKSYIGSLIGGFIFAFSSYSFAHGVGHLSLISLEFIPLFILCWYIFLKKPSVKMGIISGIVLFTVILCDYYYFFYCFVIGLIMFIGFIIQKKSIFIYLKKQYLLAFASFIIAVLLTSGYYVLSMLLLIKSDPSKDGGHLPQGFSLDLFSFIIPGAFWRFNNLTESYWSNLRGNIVESSVYLGFSILIILIYVWIKRKELFNGKIWYWWYFIIIFFAVMSIGPTLHIFGNEITFITELPYAWLERIFPPIKLGGTPVRMMIIVTLGASVICALGFKHLFRKSVKTKIVGILLLFILLIEYLPKKMPSIKVVIPEHFKYLKSLPGKSGVIDISENKMTGDRFFLINMYYQTMHEKPIATGLISRISKNVFDKKQEILRLIDRKDFYILHKDYNFRYIITDEKTDIKSKHPTIKEVYKDNKYKIYDMGK